MEINIDTKGLDDLENQLEEAQKAANSLASDMTITVESDDVEGIERAIEQMRSTVDSKMAAYKDNPFVGQLIERYKAAFEEQIRSKASGTGDDDGI